MDIRYVKDPLNWLSATVRWGLWIVGPGPRIWWRLFDDSKTSAVASVVVQTLATLLTAVAARQLGAEQYGQLAALSTAIGWFGMIASYPVASLAARFIADGKQTGAPWQRKCATAFVLGTAFAALAAAAGLVSLPRVLAYYKLTALWLPAVLLCLSFLLAPASGFGVYLLQSSGHMKQWGVLNVVFGAVPILSVLAAARLWAPLDVTRYVVALTAGGCLSAGLGLAISLRMIGLSNLVRPDFSVAGQLLRQGRGGWVAVLCSTVAVLLINTMIVKSVGRTALGHYQLVNTIGTWVYAVIISVSVPTLSAWADLAAAGRMQRLRRSLRLHQTATASVSILAAGVTLFAAPHMLGALYGDAYRDSALLLRVSTVAWVALGFACWYWIQFTALGHPGRVMVPNIVWGGVQVLLAWLLIRVFSLGELGAMVAYSVAYVSWAVGYEVVFQRTFPPDSRADPC